jgi:hypothetical protein
MAAIEVGASLILVGLVSLAAPPFWRSRLGGASDHPSAAPGAMEPDEPDIGFDLENNPCLALIAMGVILLLAGLCELLMSGSIPDPA